MRPVLVVCALVACGPLSTPPEASGPVDAPADATVDAPDGCRDGDGDGWTTGCADIPAVEVDCNDGDALIHPGALELVGTGDHDCVGGGLMLPEAFPDLSVGGLGGTGSRITTRFGRYDLDPNSGHQLGSVVVTGSNGTLSAELVFQGAPNLREMFSGVHVWDDYLAVDPDDSSLIPSTPAIAGPVVYQATVDYWAGGTVGDPSLEGTSLYTFTIDGRIIRTDELTLHTQAIYTENGPDFPGITSHLSLAALGPAGNAQLDHVAVLDDTTVVPEGLPTSGANAFHFSGRQNGLWRWLCAYGSQVEVGFASSVPANGQLRRGLRATSNLNEPVYRQLALQWDWQVGTPPAGTLTPADHVGHFLIVPHARSTGTCDLIDLQARGYLTPADVDFGSPSTGSLLTTGAHDDNHDGYDEAGGYWYLHAASPAGIDFSMVQPAGTVIPPHTLFRIDGVPHNRDPLVFIGGGRQIQGQSYRIQEDGTTGIWLAVLRGLQPGEHVELRFPDPCPQTCE